MILAHRTLAHPEKTGKRQKSEVNYEHHKKQTTQ